jgi:hypothetical protein
MGAQAADATIAHAGGQMRLGLEVTSKKGEGGERRYYVAAKTDDALHHSR